jgi:flagellar assembly protein FliH
MYMSDVIQFPRRKRIEFILDPFSMQKEEEQDNTEALLKETAEKEYERGYNECENALQKFYKENYEKEIISLKENNKIFCQELSNQLETFQKELPGTVLNLSLLIAERIILHEVALSSNIRELIENSLKKVLGAADISIKVNPDDMDIVEGDFPKVKFYSDESIERGGCLVETEIGNIDTRINSQLSELKRSIEAALVEQQ